MDIKDYQTGYQDCPFCKQGNNYFGGLEDPASDIDYEQVMMKHRRYERYNRCLHCQAEWYDVFEIVRIRGLDES